jgi:hypothetical protein
MTNLPGDFAGLVELKQGIADDGAGGAEAARELALGCDFFAWSQPALIDLLFQQGLQISSLATC